MGLSVKRTDQISFNNLLSSNGNSAAFVFDSSQMRRIDYEITKVARINVPVLIIGETGVGKDLVAKLIHSRSSRANKPFEYIPIKSLHEGLLESELFGFEKGAFTGASEDRIGKLERANTGTAYLPEISTLPDTTQLKLLEFMQYTNIERVGGGAKGKIKLDVRIIMASNEDLERLVSEGRLRKDFYYRIKVYTIEIPSLRERSGDIEILAKHFLELYSVKMTGKKYSICSDAIVLLKDHKWEGNIRELENSIIRAII
jgi:transcriptional regulator with GAF, ATPase, and Fis domain